MIYNRFDVVLVLFPFTEKTGRKRRPAIVLTGPEFNEAHAHCLTIMVTTASNTEWPSDVAIQQFVKAGLRVPNVARMKFFTIASHLILGRVGTLDPADQRRITASVTSLLRS